MLNHRLSTLVVAAAIIGFLHVHSTAQQSAVGPAQDERQNGSISGRVVTESGQPLANATVFIRPLNSNSTGRSTTTDNEGNFLLSGLDPVLYTAIAMAPAYATPLREPDSPITFFRIGDTIRLEMIRGGVITGTVTTATGEPVIGIRVRALLVRDANDKPTKGGVMSFGERTTDDRGIYRIYGLTPGTYLVMAGTGAPLFAGSVSPYDLDIPTFSPSSNRDTAAEIVVRSGEESTADIRYRGGQGHIVSGTVKLRGTIGANITLTTVGDGLITSNSFQPAASRGFAFYGIPDGDFELVAQEVISINSASPDLAFSEPRRITVKGGDVTGLELVTAPLASISGQFRLESSTIAECQGKRRPSFQESLIVLERNQKTDNDQSLFLRMYASSASPDKEGKFALRNLRPGEYAFTPRFFARYWYIQSMTLGSSGASNKPVRSTKSDFSRSDASRTWTTVKGLESLKNLTITLAEGAASIRGRISLAEGERLPEGLSVYLVPAEREKTEDVLRFFVTEVAGDGTFSLSNLPPGSYFGIAKTRDEKDPRTIDKLRLPDAAEARTKIRRAAEITKDSIDLKPCQIASDYQLRVQQ